MIKAQSCYTPIGSNMSQMIDAIYENGIFRPLSPVDLPEGTRVRVETAAAPADVDEQTRQRLLAGGATPEEAERILDNFHLLWLSYDTLTEEQKEALEESRLDQQNFFDHQSHP